jgi:prepilin-type N-terminal cleavage/methylation domain-containing protein
MRTPSCHPALPRERGFTFIELLVALSLFAAVSLFILQTFIIGMAHAGRANERTAATTIAIQVMEQIQASVNPYTMVGIDSVPARTALPLPAPYTGVVNPTPHQFQVQVVLVDNDPLSLISATVRVYRPSDPDSTPLVSLTTVLDDH